MQVGLCNLSLCVGANSGAEGQAGVALGAHLKNMGIRTLLVDKLPRVGDSWRQRYETVTSHTPTYTDHYPFLKFPENWPTWLPREKVAGWMENYSQIMGLDIMVNTTVSSINYDEAKRQYSVELQSDNGKQTLNPRHVVLAAGLFSPVPIRPNFPSEKSFKGQVYHTSEHKAARRISNVKEKKVILIGSGTSSHDIAQDFVNSGAKEVTIVQRGAIFSVSTSAIEQTIYSLWKMPGMSTEEADVVANSFPLPIIRTMGIGQSQMMSQMDKEILDGMEKAGLALRRGDDGAGIVDHQLLKGGKYSVQVRECSFSSNNISRPLLHRPGSPADDC